MCPRAPIVIFTFQILFYFSLYHLLYLLPSGWNNDIRSCYFYILNMNHLYLIISFFINKILLSELDSYKINKICRWVNKRDDNPQAIFFIIFISFLDCIHMHSFFDFFIENLVLLLRVHMKEPVASYKIIDVGEKFLEDSAITRLRLLLNCRFNLNKVLIVEYLSRSFQFELLVFSLFCFC